MRRKELEIVVDLREQLEQKRESEEREESALRSMEAQQRMLQEAEVSTMQRILCFCDSKRLLLNYSTYFTSPDSRGGVQNRLGEVAEQVF